MKIMVSVIGALLAVWMGSADAAPAGKQATKASAQVVKSRDKVNLNQADPKAIAKAMRGFGKRRAQAIVKYREEKGNYKTFQDLAKVRGISKRFIKKRLKDLESAFTLG